MSSSVFPRYGNLTVDLGLLLGDWIVYSVLASKGPFEPLVVQLNCLSCVAAALTPS